MSAAKPFRTALVFKTAVFATVCICLGYALGLLQGYATHQVPIQFELCESPPDAI
jgi:ABC-type xylose transport system permease subunit